MRTRPIIFNGEMVKAILDGKKTQTRRVWKKPKRHTNHDAYPVHVGGRFELASNGFCIGETINCPYGKIGDCLWVRETWFPMQDIGACALHNEPTDIVYKADWDADGISREEARGVGIDRWRPSIFMPRWASRIELEIIGVRVERVQDIKAGDVAAEGWPDAPDSEYIWTPDVFRIKEGFDWFRELWDSINAKRGFGWGVNPWVWVVEFQILGD